MNSRSIALLTGTLIATITTAFLWMVPSITQNALVICWLLSFSSSYILVRVLLDSLFFRHINTIYARLQKMQDKDFTPTTGRSLNPLKKINKELGSYVASKEEEIERLKQLETFRREFLADISHELKTPLFAAQGFVHTLLDGAIKDKSVRDKFLKKAARSLDGLDILVQDLMTISQMETGQVTMHFESFDIIPMALQLIDQMEGKAEKKNLVLKLANDPKKEIFVHADYQRIYQVLANLVSNAIKYTKKKREVVLQFEENPTGVVCRVIDQGYGIPQEDISRIFERFYRVDKSRSKERGGTGLGLAIVKHIMEGHGSQVHVESEVDEGSTFSFELIKGSPVPLTVDEDED